MSANDDVTSALNTHVWGGSLLGVQFDPVAHVCELTTEIVDSKMFGPAARQHVLTCGGVTELRFDNAIPLPWNYAEITEVHARYDPLGQQWLLELMLWSEESSLTIRCAELAVDGFSASPP